ncbi:DUF1993 domain-containing protein [Halioxenophilus aromaticivorans]|uniref:DUF1993 domain-containing protein n=1 Tax=Halioxenophilus aromaticivorans TaxID=1306992 RepID=A0AAV3U3X9_9ALTE
MTISLYDATIPTYLQITNACLAQLEKAQAWCTETNTAEQDIVQSRIIEDMYPLAYQIKSVHTHSVGALEGLKQGVFSPNMDEAPGDLAGLKSKLQAAVDYLQNVDKDELNGRVGAPMRFEFKDYNLPFTAETFLFSFSQPNFYFHATTAYDLLRAKGVPVGKLDFLGALQIQQ